MLMPLVCRLKGRWFRMGKLLDYFTRIDRTNDVDNQGCDRCGACCVYFRIEDVDRENLPLVSVKPVMKVISPGWEACEYLRYDADAKVTSCDAYNDRPKDCRVFECKTNLSNTGREFVRKPLGDIAEKIRGLGKSGKVKDLLKL